MTRVAILITLLVVSLSVIVSHRTRAQIASADLLNTGSPWVPVGQFDWVDCTKLEIISFDAPSRLIGNDGQVIEVSGALDLSALKGRLLTNPAHWVRVRTAATGDDQIILANLECCTGVRAQPSGDGLEYRLFFPGNKVAVAAHLRASMEALEQMLRSGLPSNAININHIVVLPATRPSQSTSRPSGFGNP